MNRKVHEVASANGGEVVGEEYFPVDHADWGEMVDRINSSGADVVFNTTVPPGCFPFLEALYASGYADRGGRIVTTYFDENLVEALPSKHVEGLYRCIDYYQSVSDPFSRELLGRYSTHFPHQQADRRGPRHLRQDGGASRPAYLRYDGRANHRLPDGHRREHVRAIESAKKPETRLRRIERALATLRNAGS